ncbi:hypothetical protein CR513_25277, partial [Mucuna pruriens]
MWKVDSTLGKSNSISAAKSEIRKSCRQYKYGAIGRYHIELIKMDEESSPKLLPIGADLNKTGGGSVKSWIRGNRSRISVGVTLEDIARVFMGGEKPPQMIFLGFKITAGITCARNIRARVVEEGTEKKISATT